MMRVARIEACRDKQFPLVWTSFETVALLSLSLSKLFLLSQNKHTHLLHLIRQPYIHAHTHPHTRRFSLSMYRKIFKKNPIVFMVGSHFYMHILINVIYWNQQIYILNSECLLRTTFSLSLTPKSTSVDTCCYRPCHLKTTHVFRQVKRRICPSGRPRWHDAIGATWRGVTWSSPT